MKTARFVFTLILLSVCLGASFAAADTELFDNLNGNGYTAFNFSNITGSFLKGNLSWGNLTDFPVSCPANSFISALGSAVTCTVQDLSRYNATYAAINSSNWVVSGSNIYNRNSGNIGIGTTSPSAKVDVYNGTLRLRGNAQVPPLTGDGLEIVYNGAIGYLFTYNRTGGFYLPTILGGSTVTLNANGTSALTAISGGNVGIGTSEPQANMHISKTYTVPTGGISSNTGLIVSNNNIANGVANIAILSRSSGTSTINFGNQLGENLGQINYGGVANSNLANAMSFVTSGSERMRISDLGYVGIGTTNPVYKLSVSNGGANGIEFDPTSLSGRQTVVLSYNRQSTAYTPLVLVANNFTFQTPSAVPALTILNSGNVGIGTTNPEVKLDIQASSGSIAGRIWQTSGNAPANFSLGSGSWWNLVSNPVSGTNAYGFEIQKSGSPKFTIDTNGNIKMSQNLNITGNYSAQGIPGLSSSFNCTSSPNVTIKGGLITAWAC